MAKNPKEIRDSILDKGFSNVTEAELDEAFNSRIRDVDTASGTQVFLMLCMAERSRRHIETLVEENRKSGKIANMALVISALSFGATAIGVWLTYLSVR